MSTLKVGTIQNASGVEVYTAKAWVNFNGTGTVEIRASGNVSSITDNGVGDYTVNFTTAMPDANYAVIGTTQGDNGNDRCFLLNSTLDISCRVRTTLNGSSSDRSIVCASIFR